MNDWFPLKNSLKRGAKKLASQEIRVRKHITPTIFPDLISILHVVPWLFFQEYLLTYVKNSPILDFLIICKPTIKWILNVFGIPVYISQCCILLRFCHVNTIGKILFERGFLLLFACVFTRNLWSIHNTMIKTLYYNLKNP